MLAEFTDDVETPAELAEEDKEFLNRLEEMAKEVDDEPNNTD